MFNDVLQPEALFKLNEENSFNTSGSSAVLTDASVIHDALLLLGLNTQQQQSMTLCHLLRSPHTIDYDEELEGRLVALENLNRHSSRFLKKKETSLVEFVDANGE